jgi:hypothetical protein
MPISLPSLKDRAARRMVVRVDDTMAAWLYRTLSQCNEKALFFSGDVDPDRHVLMAP